MQTPPEALRIELEHQRSRGRTFRAAWPISVSVAVDGLAATQQALWRGIFSEHRSVWAANYSGPCFATRLFIPERDPAERARGVLVA